MNVLPAPAGMSLDAAAHKVTDASAPRARGDEPT